MLGGSAGSALAGVESWRVNEVSSSATGDPAIRFVELYAPPSAMADNCFFPSTRLEILAADGASLGTVTPFTTTTCYAGDTYFLFAPPEAGVHYAVTRDAPLPYAIPESAAQVCLRSSSTRYDCLRWGAVTMPITDLGDPSDTSSAPSLGDSASLARIATTDIVAMDFALQTPTPRLPNDGSPWFPPDAGPPADAGQPRADAAYASDSAPSPIDAAPGDGRESPDWLTADPGGGGCSVGTHLPISPFFAFLLIPLIFRRRAR